MPARSHGHERTAGATPVRRGRACALGLAGLLAAGCAGSAAPAPDDPVTGTAPATVLTTVPATTTTSTVVTTTTAAPEPRPEPWVPSAAEPQPDAKQLAARVVEVLGTYPPGGGTVEAAQARLEASGLPPGLATTATGLLVPGAASVAQVVYPQSGGLTATGTSLMVVVRVETTGAGGETTTAVRTVDVRLERDGGPWRAAAVASDGGSPPEAPAPPSPEVAAVLAHPRIDLPDSVAWDLRAGGIDPRVPQLLLLLADQHDLRVAVVSTGHPTNVFGTERVSNHTVGRAVDIWAVDGVPVVDQQRSPALESVVATALAFGTSEVGAPFDTDGPGGRVFTNTVHLDHLHLGFDSR